MADKQTFALHLYDTKALIITLVGVISLGTMILLGVQHIWFIPNWTQYAVLTALIAVAFVVSRYLSTRSAKVQIKDQTIIIEQTTKPAKILPLQDIDAYTYYEELLLYSLKISLHSHKTLSIIDFKWGDQTDFQTFFRQFEWLMASSGNRHDVGPVVKSKTFYGSRIKLIITIVMLILYSSIAIFLSIRGVFASWNPIWTYFFWVLPTAFFIKMWRAK
jgi:hypothetical protein